MQIVINISEEMYENALNDRLCGSEPLVNAIKNGIPLPEGHGNLIDAKDLIPDADYEDGIFGAVSCQQIVEAEAIIEADEEENEKTETWNGIHAQIIAPKGTFERIYNDADDDNDI